MAIKPIVFSAPMVRAILEGRKFQTRRILKIIGHKTYSDFGPSDTAGYEWHFRDSAMRWHDLRDSELKSRLQYLVNDRLWVREAWRTECNYYDDLAPASMSGDETILFDADEDYSLNKSVGRARQSIHMPQWASRISLSVTQVKVHRLQGISAADAISEGIPPQEDPIGAFRNLWDWINASRGFGWQANPWVIAITFTPEVCNINDQIVCSWLVPGKD